MCEPLRRLLILPEDLKKRPLDWLNWLYENDYLEFFSKPLRDWYGEHPTQLKNKELKGRLQDDDTVKKAETELQGNNGKETLTPIQTTKRKRGPTKITIFLEGLCQNQDIDSLNGESLIRAIKLFEGKLNSPVKKYHGFYKKVSVEWKPGNGSIKGSWGSKKFQNFVSEYKNKNSEKTCQENISPIL